MKLISLLLLSFFLCGMLQAETVTATSYDGGTGTSSNPYQIATLAQLRRLSETTGDWGKCFVLTADINAADTKTWNQSKGFSRIGVSSTLFTGVFDGQGYVVDSLYISYRTEGNGMFGYTKRATIKNLGLTNSDLNLGSKSGGLVGYAADSTVIEKCFLSGIVKGYGVNVLGGLVGVLSSSYIKSSYTNCTVSVSESGNIGGLAGIIWGSSMVENCFVAGTSDFSYYGGITGQNESSAAIIKNCYVSGKVSNTACVITGNNEGKIYRCYYDKTINSGSCSHATGIVSSAFSDETKFSGWDFTSTWKILTLTSVDSVMRPNLQWSYDHLVTFELGTNGNSIAGGDIQGIDNGANGVSVKAIGADGYILKEWQDGKGNLISLNNPLTVTNVTQDSTLYAIFKAGYKVEFSTDGNGAVIGDLYQGVTSGNNATEVTANANTGYHFDEWRNAAGDSITNINPLTISNVTQDSALNAIFEIDTYIVSFSTDGNGTINGGASQSVTYDSDATAVTATPVSGGYLFVEWQDTDGNAVSTDNPLTVTHVVNDSTLKAVFIQKYDSGAGTSDNPYRISTLDQLKKLSEVSSDWSSCFVLTTDIDATDTKNWNNGKGFSPIGNNTSTTFTGTFNGKGHTISNLYIHRTSSDCIGLFGFVMTGRIDSLGIIDCDLSGGENTGGMVGYNYKNSIISNSYSTGSVSGTSNVGGLVGENVSGSEVSDCYSTVNVSGNDYVGGLVGLNYYSGKVLNCYSTGSVPKVSGCGGLVGKCAYSTVTNSYYNKETSGVDKGIALDYDNQIVTGLTTAQFSDASNFSGWDFTSIWKVLALTSSDGIKRPNLQWSYDHVVTFELGANGDTINGASIQGVANNSSALEVTAVAKAGYQFKNWQDKNGNVMSADNPFVLTNVTSDITIYATFDINTGVDNHGQSEITLFPNPATDMVYISGADNSIISVCNITGERVYYNNSFSGGAIDLSEFKNGIYIIKINSNGKTSLKKLIKK